MAWRRLARKRCKTRWCCWPLSHTRMAALWIITTGTMTGRCKARKRCETCWYCWHCLPHADGSAVDDLLRRDVLLSHRSQGLQTPLARLAPSRMRCWQHCARTHPARGNSRPHPARWPGSASLVRDTMPASAAGTFTPADGSTAGSHTRHEGKAQPRTQEIPGMAGAAGPLSHTLKAAR